MREGSVWRSCFERISSWNFTTARGLELFFCRRTRGGLPICFALLLKTLQRGEGRSVDSSLRNIHHVHCETALVIHILPHVRHVRHIHTGGFDR